MKKGNIMQGNREYSHFAFISYCHTNQKEAEKLRIKIESYRLPTVLRNELETSNGKKFPPYLKPLWLATTDLGPCRLEEGIVKELDDSQFLIVVCSPDSAKSMWVNQEVEHFILMGRYDNIIPYIIDGSPNSGDPDTECFPPILRQERKYVDYSFLTKEENEERHKKLDDMLVNISPVTGQRNGGSLPTEGPRISRLKVIAGMLGVVPEILIQRDKQRRKKNIITASCIALFFIALFSFVGYKVWDRYIRMHVDYYADYVETMGVPEGIFPLTSEQIKQRNSHYRIYTRNQKVRRLEHVNAFGIPIPVKDSEFKDRPMIAEYSYPDNNEGLKNEGLKIKHLDNNGQVLMLYNYSDDKMNQITFTFRNDSGRENPISLKSVTSMNDPFFGENSSGNRGEIGKYILERDDNGRITKEKFYKSSTTYDVPTTDKQGISGFEYKRDEIGRVIEVRYLGSDYKKLCPDKNGVVRRVYQYDPNGNLYDIQYFGMDGNLTSNENGWMHCIKSYNDEGNCIKEKYVDASGKNSLSNNDFCGMKYDYDDHGCLREVAFFDIDEKPCLVSVEKKLFQIEGSLAKVVYQNDGNGRRIEEAYFDADGNPCLCLGIAKSRFQYDERGNLIELSSYDAAGKRCKCSGGYSILRSKYDVKGNDVEHAFYDANDRPCLSIGKYYKGVIIFDEIGNVTSIEFFGTDEKPCISFLGCAKLVREYDPVRGNLIEEDYYDADGNLCQNWKGYAKVTTGCDTRGNTNEFAFWDAEGNLCNTAYGYARETVDYDDHGNIIQSAWFDKNNNLCENEDGYAKAVIKYDDQDNMIDYKAYDSNGNLLIESNGYCRASEDGQKNKYIKGFLDDSEHFCLPEDGVIKTTLKYNKNWQLVEQRFYSISDKPCMCNGYAKCTKTYDKQGKIVVEAFFDIDDKPCMNIHGYSKCTFKYNNQNNLIESAYFDIDGKPCLLDNCVAKCKMSYNEQGKMIELAFYGIDNNLCLSKNKFAKMTTNYDEQGNAVELAYFDANGQSCMGPKGFAKTTMKYNEKGRLIEQSYFDANDKLCLNNDGYAKVVFQYDSQNKITSIDYFDTNGQFREDHIDNDVIYFDSNNQPCLKSDAVIKMVSTYDDFGNIIEQSYYTLDDKPCMCKNGFFKCSMKYDKQGNKIEDEYFDIYGKPCEHIEGYAKTRFEYDERGELSGFTYFDINGKPYQTVNHKLFEVFLDKNGEECEKKDAVVKKSVKTNDHDNIIETAYFRLDGKLCVFKDGYAKCTYKYDNHDNPTEEAFFDANDKSCLCEEGYAKKTIKYDEQGNHIEDAYFGIDDKPALYKGEYAKITSKYDKQGNIIELAYFGVDGKPCMCKKGYAKMTMEFDDQGNQTEMRTFGADDKPCSCDDDYPMTGSSVTFHNNGSVAKRIHYFTVKPYNNVLGKWVMEYDEQGNITAIYSLDMKDQPCLSDLGFAKKTNKYDEKGNNVEETYFGVDGKPCLHMEGYAKVVKKFDGQGNLIEVEFFGIDDQPCLHRDGFAKIRFEYDEQGNQTKRINFDLNGKELVYCVSVQEVDPDSNGKKFGIQAGDFFILYDGQPVESVDSFIEKRSKETGEDTHELVVLRNNEFVTIQTHPGLLGCNLIPKALSDEQQKLFSEKLKDVKNN